MSLKHFLIIVFMVLSWDLPTKAETLNAKKLNCSCGAFQESPKYADGMAYVSGEFPWLVEILQKGKVTKDNYRIRICWGTLINDRYILTTATCMVTGLRWRYSDEIEVYLRGFSRNLRRRRSVESIVIHGLYNRSTYSQNLALLKLSRPLQNEINLQNVIPICLPLNRTNPYSVADGAIMIKSQNYKSVFFSSDKYYVAQLHTKITRRDFGKEGCTNIFTRRPKSELCWDDKKLACYGEHGSILASKLAPNVYGALGVYSKGFGCNEYSESNEPSDVLIELSSNLEWVQHNARDGLYCSY